MSNIKLSQKRPILSVEIDQIPEEPCRFLMSYGFDNSELIKSISQVGIINNPYIFRNAEGIIEIVTGYRRILALKELGIKLVECFDLTDSGLSPFDMLKFALYDNLYTRNFNLVEKSIILNELTSLVKDDNSINKYISLINVNFRDYELILKIEEMDESIKGPVSTGSLNIKTLEQLIQLNTDSQMICVNWINNLKLNYNQQIQFIDYINDISRIEKISIKKLLDEQYYLSLLADNKKNTPQKAKELIDNLRERRNPDYHECQQIFEKKIRKLQLPKNIKIKHPRYFESEGYQVEIEFKNGSDLKKSLEMLLSRDGLESIDDPWKNKKQ
ncbi:MAG: ParB N-terminal domain-containing protein [Desulfobacteraceae bacterium]|jgi:hypothetical protein